MSILRSRLGETTHRTRRIVSRRSRGVDPRLRASAKTNSPRRESRWPRRPTRSHTSGCADADKRLGRREEGCHRFDSDRVSSKVGDVTPDGAEVTQGVNRMKRLAERNPVGLAIGGAAVGFIAGVLLPSTRVEDERIGPMADEVKATAAEAGREALDRGKDVVQEAGATAIETAKERGREEGEELSESLQEKAREVVPGKSEKTSLSSLSGSTQP